MRPQIPGLPCHYQQTPPLQEYSYFTAIWMPEIHDHLKNLISMITQYISTIAIAHHLIYM
jgi:hypothetical protein